MQDTSERFCSHDDDRSFVDPVTGLTILSPVDFCHELVNITTGVIKPPWLPTFLHEMTHHWCVTSPLGAMLGLLRMRVQRNAAKKGITYERLITDELLYTLILHHLRPLSEGLALFAQFDALPAHSPVLSLPMASLMRLYGHIDLMKRREEGAGLTEDFPEISLAARDVLVDARLSEVSIESKINLLASSLTNSNGGYLLGYMAVKNWWILLTEKCKKFEDSDLFLNYLKSFFHDDFGVFALLETTSDPVQVYRKVLTYFSSRWLKLLAVDKDELAASVESFEQFLNTPLLGFQEPSQAPGLLTDEATSKAGQDLFSRLLDEIDGNGDLEDPIALAQRWIWLQRDLICVGTTPGTIAINGEKMLGVICSHRDEDGSKMVLMKKLREPSPHKPAVYIEYYFSQIQFSEFMIVFQEGVGIIAFNAMGSDERALLSRIENSFMGREDLNKAMDSLELFVRKVLYTSEDATKVIQVLKTATSRDVESNYTTWSLMGVLNANHGPAGDHPSVKLLQDSGFWKFCKNKQVLKALAKFSAALALGDSQSLSRLNTEEIEASMDFLERLEEEFDLHLSGRIEGSLQLRI